MNIYSVQSKYEKEKVVHTNTNTNVQQKTQGLAQLKTE